jgi:hypothetical protein
MFTFVCVFVGEQASKWMNMSTPDVKSANVVRPLGQVLGRNDNRLPVSLEQFEAHRISEIHEESVISRQEPSKGVAVGMRAEN